MRALLLGLAAATAFASPATALDPEQMAFAGNFGVSIHSGTTFGGGHNRGFRRRNDGVFIYDRDYQGDSAWRSDSFNDWWHDNPQRAYPRWMVGNQNCERQW